MGVTTERYRIERQDGETSCEHPLCDTLHQRFMVRGIGNRGLEHIVRYVQWHVWDEVAGDYAGNGDACEFETKREARQWLDGYLAAHPERA